VVAIGDRVSWGVVGAISVSGHNKANNDARKGDAASLFRKVAAVS
jgi:hypothetical protein